MLVNTREMTANAQANGYAIGGFNTYNLEITLGIIRAAGKLHAPVILQVGAMALDYGRDTLLSALALAAADAASAPVAVHLDHARDLDVLGACLERGFTSVMFDGSALSFAENIARTEEAVALAHAANVPIEGELGAMTSGEDGSPDDSQPHPFTDPEQAACFVEETGVDSLAVAIGNAHGFYKDQPLLDFERLAAIREQVSAPLVLHGASGIPEGAIRQAIEGGICKINVNTDLRYAFFQALQAALAGPHPAYNLPRLMTPAIEAVAETVAGKIALFGSAGRA